MVSLTNLKVKGYTLQALDNSDFGVQREAVADVYVMMRAMFTNVLKPEDTQEKVIPFTDVAAGTWYEEAVRYVYEHQIMTGMDGTHFGPDDPITREQMAVMLYRYARYKGYDIENTLNMTDFADKAEISQFAEEAVAWAAAERLIKGENGFIHPQGNTNRAMCAVIIQRFMEL